MNVPIGSSPDSERQLIASKTPFALWGVLFVVLGVTVYAFGAGLGALRALFRVDVPPRWLIESILWYSALPVVLGVAMVLFDLRLVRMKRKGKTLRDEPLSQPKLCVALTAYNDEQSIAAAVADFLAHPAVRTVIVVDNNSRDGTAAVARAAGATVVHEPEQGYGACVRRALREASAHEDADVVVICEGDMTFRAADIDKLLPFLRHADVVNGTRIVDVLQQPNTQVTTFMHYGNLAVSKLLELKFLGSATLTDVGTTYKVMRKDIAKLLSESLPLRVNLEFNPYLMQRALELGLKFIEVPITFHPRVGQSKGGNVSDWVAFRVGCRMIIGILFGWRWICGR